MAIKKGMEPRERLIIDNFFSIEHFDWEIKDFNILTGEMASGKSLCLKLVHFIEQIFSLTIFNTIISKDSFTKEVFYSNITEKFSHFFHSIDKENDFRETSISYFYSFENATFDLSAKWDDNAGNLKWNSEYINERIDEWRGFFINGNTPDAAQNVRTRIQEKVAHDFSSTFPIWPFFIPASRAIAAIASPLDIQDPYFQNFIRDIKPFILDFEAPSDKNVNKILHLNGITVKRNKDPNRRIIEALTLDGRKITPLEFSSGQQELIYLLLYIKILAQSEFLDVSLISIFIEEPSAHLFPNEQKESIEYIVKIFKELQRKNKNNPEMNNKVRFFISTHSPYVLNVINNMLKKGHLIEKTNNCSDENKKKLMQEEIEKLAFPHLNIDEISAHFIQKEVSSMINESENGAYLYEKMIEEISQKIDDDYNQVRDLLRRFRE
jgi:predicted ATPase